MKLYKYYFFFILLGLFFSACHREGFIHPEKETQSVNKTTLDSSLIYGNLINDSTKVLLIGIGGCSGDAIRVADAPNIHGMLAHAIYNFNVQTQPPMLNGPGWATLLTGVWSDKHGVTDNTFGGNNFLRYATLFSHIKELRPSLQTASICSRDILNEQLIKSADVKINTNNNDAAASDSAIAYLKKKNTDVVFLQLSGVAEAGQQFGFDTSKSAYMQSVSQVDDYIGKVLQAINNKPETSKDDWLVILTTNQGGNAVTGKNTFFIFYNPKFPSKEIIPFSSLKSIYFKEVNQYAYLENTTGNDYLNFDSYPGFTIRLLVKSDNFENDDPILANKNWHSGRNPGWTISVDGQSWRLNVADGSSRLDIHPDGAPDIADGQWHSIAIAVDKDNAVVKLFQDGILYNTVGIADIDSWMGGSDKRLVTGDDITGDYRKDWGISEFSIANIKIWNTVLSDEYLGTHPACDTLPAADDAYNQNLVGWWKVTDGNGSIIKDSGPNKMDMQINGSPLWIKQESGLCNIPLPPVVPVPYIVDIVPSIYTWLNIDIDPQWQLDGGQWLP